MKKIAAILALALLCLGAAAQQAGFTYTEASELGILGKILPGTPNPYHRVDTVRYKGFTASENRQVRCASGLAVVFETDSRSISISADYGYVNSGLNTMPISIKGFDLYIEKNGEWVWAAVAAPKPGEKEMPLISGMTPTMKRCLLYLPLYSELYSCRIGVESGATLRKAETPFRHKVAVFGSSYTHGISTSKPGMTYPAQFTRRTGIQMLSLGCSGNCKMQPYFAAVLEDVEADAFLFDCFSNPTASQIEERLEPFIQRMLKAHPGKPLIFQQTIYRAGRTFDTEVDKKESAKMDMADKLMKAFCDKYPDVYFIVPQAGTELGEYSVDGIHPDDYGYLLWERSIEQPLLEILGRYGIR